MRHLRLFSLAILVGLVFILSACTQPAPTPTATLGPQPTPTERPPMAEVIVFSTSAPNVSVIDTGTNTVVRSGNIPGFNSWSWIDSNTYTDGKSLWFGMRNPDTNDAEIVALDLDTLQLTTHLPVGKETHWLYTGKATSDGKLFVAKHGSRQVVIIDTKTRQILKTVDVPIKVGEKERPPAPAAGAFGGSVACDIDVSMGPDGILRVFYPTWDGDTVVSLDEQGQPLRNAALTGTSPVMLSAAPDGTVWVQEIKTTTNAVLNPVTLDVIARFTTGKFPSDVAFGPDGKLGYVAGGDTGFTVVDVATRQVIREVKIGNNASEVGPHPDGKTVYVAVSREGAIAVVDTATWKVTKSIPLGTNPSFLVVRNLK